MTAPVGFAGHAPATAVGNGNPEAVKYGHLWEREEYRRVAPGEQLVPLFLDHARPKPGAQVIDFGCGTGRAALALASHGLKVTMIDFARNCLDDGVREALCADLKFVKHDLEKPLSINAQYGYCTDVMEHIPTLRVDFVLDTILKATQHVFFSISTTEDVCGKLIDEPLHLTIQSYGWWLHKFAQRDAVVHWSEESDDRCLFYVTAWSRGRKITKSGVLNVEEQVIRDNVAHNIKQGWIPLIPHAPNDIECMILGGSPSLRDFEAEIRARRRDGVKLITLNGTYNWCLDLGLIPSAQIIVDARPFNARFTKPVVDGCKYLIASQCHPSVFEGLPKDRTFIWHTSPHNIADLLNEQYDTWFSVPGGSTVLLRTLPLMRMLGYQKFHLYGCDSCLSESDHHAYSQPENDGGVRLPVTLPDGRIFYGYPWMISQAQEFMDLISKMGDLFDLEIHGDGLLKHILMTAASTENLKVKEI